jgi:hypothetical protein
VVIINVLAFMLLHFGTGQRTSFGFSGSLAHC